MLRRATADDLTSLLPLVRDFYEIDHHPYDESRVVDALRPLLADDTFGQVWVVDESGSLGGYSVVTWGYSLESGGRECILDEIYVASQSAGVGSELLTATLEGARLFGARSMFLETEAHNSRVRGFYLRHGFEIDDSVWMSRSLEVHRDTLD